MRAASGAALCVGMVALAGCSSGGMPPAGVVHGMVKYKGQPVSGGTVAFYSAEQNAKSTAAAQIGTDGSYVVYEAPPGTVKVTVAGVDTKSGPAMYPGQTIPKGAVVTGAPPETRKSDAPPPPPKGTVLPAKYAKVETTTLFFEVKRDGNQRFDIELTD